MAVDPHLLWRLIVTEGGFTLDHRTGRVAKTGISLCTRPSRSLTFGLHQWDDAEVASWLGKRDRDCARDWRSPYIGGWLDPSSNTVWLDVVRIIPSKLRPAACLAGRALRQRCLFDLGRQETVALRSAAR